MMKDIGLRETTGNNDGEHIKVYMKYVGLNYNKHYPYCMAAQYTFFKKASDSLHKPCPIPRTASTNTLIKWSQKNGIRRTYEAKINDLVLWNKRGTPNGHVERVVTTRERGNIETGGFNTSNGMKGSQSNGNGNFIRKRNIYTPIGRMQIKVILGFEDDPKNR